MQVGMDEFLHLLASGTNAATIGFRTVGTQNVLRVGQGQRQLATARWTQKELGVRHMVVLHALDKALLEVGLSDDVFELHLT